MARQGTAKQAIDSQSQLVSKPANVVTQEQRDMLAKANAPVAPTGPGNVSKPLSNVVDTMPLNPTPINTPAPVAPRVEGQWNYGTNEAQVLGEKPTVAPTQPTPTVKPASASQAIAQGFKQEIKPVVAKAQPLTTEIGREAKLGQLPTVQQAQNQAEQDRINTSNLKSQSGNQLWSNLESISSTNQSLLNDRKAFDQAFGYDGKDVSEKALVDAFWKSKRLDSSSIYNSLATGTTIPNESKNTPAFTDALIRHQDTTRFENLNPYQLSKVINSELIPGTQTYNDLIAKNPQLVTDAMKLASINTPVTARSEPKTNWQDNLSNYLSRSPVMSNPTTVATIMNSDPNIATKTNEVQAVEDKLTEAKDRLKNVQKSVTERYKGTGATKQTVNAKALAESQDIIDEITMLEANKASASSALTTLIQNAKDNYTYARQDREDALAQYNKGFEQLTAMTKMGMDADNEQYKRQQDATARDLQLLLHYDEQDQANAREQRGYAFQMKRDEQNFGQQKELAKMGYNQQYNMANLNYNQDINKLRLANDMQTNKDLQTRVMDMRQQGYSDQEIQNTIYGQPAQTQVGDLSGAELMKVLASGKLNGNKFFGVYATADMDGTDRANIYKKAENIGLEAFVNQYKGTKITPEMINIAAQKTGMDPLMIATVMAADSSMGTKGLGARNNNPGNVGQFDSLGTKGVAGYKTLQDGVNAVAENLQKRVNALIPKLPKSQQSGGQATITSTEQNLTPLAKSSYQSKTLVGTPTQQSQILAELTRKGLIGNGEGNANLYQAKPADKKEMVTFIQGDNLMRKADDIIQRRVNDGTLSEMFGLGDKYGLILANKLPNAIKLPNEIKMGEDFKALQTILGKELSSYMKEVSGATVADAEVARLMKQIPSLDEWSSDTFLSSWNSYKDTMNDAKKGFVNQYGFTDMPTAAKVLLGTSSKPTQQTAQSVGLTQIGSSTQGQSNAPVNQKTYDDVMSRVQARRQSLNK